MKRASFFSGVLAFILSLTLLSAPSAYAESSASAVVHEFHDQLLKTMKQGKALGFEGRYKKLIPVVKKVFNLPLMTRVAVGSAWAKATDGQKQELTSAFSAFSVSTYAKQFASYNGEVFAITGEKASKKEIIVETTLTPKEEPPVVLNYLMRPDETGTYRIVDVFLNGTISQLAMRRSQFSSIARREGVQSLIKSLKEKASAPSEPLDNQ